jgi:cobalt-zinc-cadmium efflux system protein
MTDCGAEHPESGARQHHHPGAGGDPGHEVTASSDSRYIATALGLIVSFLVFEVIMAVAGHSLALLADAGHMLTDAGALAASLLAVRLARRPAAGAWTFGFKRADAIASLIVVALMLHTAWGLLRETGRILLEAAPQGYAPGEIVSAITRHPGVASVHDVHVWLITSGFPARSAHVLVQRPADCHQVRRELEQLLCERFTLDHTTLQVDHAPDELLTIGDTT